MNQQLVGGAWVNGTGTMFQSVNPVTQTVVWQGNAAGAPEVDAAISAARGAFEAWSLAPLEDRLAIVRAFAKRLGEEQAALAAVIGRETGKPLWEAMTEVTTMIAKVEISIKAYL